MSPEISCFSLTENFDQLPRDLRERILAVQEKVGFVPHRLSMQGAKRLADEHHSQIEYLVDDQGLASSETEGMHYAMECRLNTAEQFDDHRRCHSGTRARCNGTWSKSGSALSTPTLTNGQALDTRSSCMAMVGSIVDNVRDVQTDASGRAVGECGSCLPGGQKQRLAITRALLKNPDVLDLDEATLTVDATRKVQTQVPGKVRRLFLGRTLILISHRDSTLVAAYLRTDRVSNELWLEQVV